MSVFTIFFCGTGSNSTDSTDGANSDFFHDGELVSKLASNMTTPQYSNWIIVDGPGSGNYQANQKWTNGWRYPQPLGALLGAGWGDNVSHAMAVLKNDTSQMPCKNKESCQQHIHARNGALRPTVVNLVGWSRGAVTCHLMANAMQRDPATSDMAVNIFAIDPVPGLGNQLFLDCTGISSNVREYIGVYARDERSTGFSAVVPCHADTTIMKTMGIPGRHATLVGNASITGNGETGRPTKLPQPGKIVRCLAEQALTQWGTIGLGNQLGYTNDMILELYDDIHAHEGDYYAMRSNTYTITHSVDNQRNMISGNRWRLNTLARRDNFDELVQEPTLAYSSHDPIFINRHHQELFLRTGLHNREPRFWRNKYPHTYSRYISVPSKITKWQ